MCLQRLLLCLKSVSSVALALSFFSTIIQASSTSISLAVGISFEFLLYGMV